ncbi:DUF6600 domain-containing protein [Xylophilus sp. GW821-FHT01B05]
MPSFSLLVVLRRFGMAAALLGATLALAQEATPVDPPTRIARFDSIYGTAQHQSAADSQTRPADPNWPIAPGDRVWTEPAARAVLDSGGATLRLDGSTVVEFTTLDDSTTQVQLTQGTLGVRLYATDPNQRYEIDTPNLALVLVRPGTYRLDVDPAQGITRVSALPGANGIVYGEGGQSLTLEGGQRRDFVGRGLSSPGQLYGIAGDAFDGWQADLDRASDQSVSATYVSRDLPGYQVLDNYGDWQNDNSYGAVWFPRAVAANWAPYRDGRWEWIAPWGWTWIDDAPWGFTPFHYGRWAQVGSRWGWVPGRAGPRPVYSPALVGFVGVGGGATVPMGSGRPGVAWFPLAPGERWRPAFQASPGYLARLNRSGQVRDHGDQYQFQSRPGAVTALPSDSFGSRGRGQRQQMETLTAGALAQARPVMPPPFSGALAPSRPGMPAAQPFRLPPGQPMPPNTSMPDQLRQQQADRQRQQFEMQQQLQRQQQPFRDAQQNQNRPPPGFDPQRGQIERQQREQQMQQQQQQQQMQQDQQMQMRQRMEQQRQGQMRDEQMRAAEQQQRQMQQQQQQAQQMQQERQMQMQREQAARQQDMQMRQRMEQQRAEQQQRQMQQQQQQAQQMQQMQMERQQQLQQQQQQMQQRMQPQQRPQEGREGRPQFQRERGDRGS